MTGWPEIPRSRFPQLGRWLLFFLILIAFGRGIFDLGQKSLWWDESLSLHRARGSLSSVFTNKIYLTDTFDTVETIDNHPPLYFAMLWVAVRLWGESEFALRFLSLIGAVLTVPLLYVTGRRLVDERAGLAAAALGALSPMYLWYGQEARMYALLPFFGLLSFYSFVRAFLQPSHYARSRRTWLATFVAANLALVLTHYLGVLLILFELIVLGGMVIRLAQNRRGVLAITAIILSLSLPLMVYAFITLPAYVQQPGVNYVPLPDLLRDLLNSFSLGLSVDINQWSSLAINLIFLTFLVVGLLFLLLHRTCPAHRLAGGLLGGYLLVPVATIYLISHVQPAYMGSRHMILISPAFYLLVGTGLTRLRKGWAAVSVLGAGLMILGIGLSTWNYFHDPTYEKDNHREWGNYLRAHTRPGDVVVVEPPHVAELYRYYADSGVPWVGLPLLNGSRDDTIAALEELRGRYDRVWLAFSSTPARGDQGRIPQRWLDANLFRTDYKPIHSYGSLVLVATYLPTWPSVGRLPLGAQPLEVRYSTALRLTGYQLITTPQAGERLHLKLYWAIDEPIPEEASVVLRLVDHQGQLWGQSEQCPYNGLYPMWQWQPGLLLFDEHELAIQPGTPPGDYQIEMVLVSRPTEDGCFGPQGGSIPPLVAPSSANRGDRVLLGTVTIPTSDTPVSVDREEIENRQRGQYGGLRLLGSNLAPAQLTPGERLAVTLFWQASAAPLPDAQFRLQLVDKAGTLWQEMPIRPAGDAHPTDRWHSSDQFKGQFLLRLPPDAPGGSYRVLLVAEPPLQRTDLGSTVRRALGVGDEDITLGRVQVEQPQGDLTPAPGTPVPTPSDRVASHPMLATLGEGVRFLGYDLETDAAHPGETVSFTLYWQCLQPMDLSYTVFTHLLGPSMEVTGQKDSLPLDGAYPTTQWQPGEVIADRYSFAVFPDAPPGIHQIEIGMYRAETDTRLSAWDAQGQRLPDDRILIGEITVLPPVEPTPDDQSFSHWIYLPVVSNASRNP